MNVSSYTDKELIEALKDKNSIDDAIRFIYKHHYRVIEYYVTTNNGNQEDAADVMQETLVAFVEIVERNKFRGEASVQSFLYTLARNLWLTELRKKNSRESRNTMFEKGKEIEDREITYQIIYNEHQKAINKLFEKLGAVCKKLLLLVYYEDMNMKDILKLMPDYSNEQVLRNKKYKCMKQLEEMIEVNASLKAELKNALLYGR